MSVTFKTAGLMRDALADNPSKLMFLKISAFLGILGLTKVASFYYSCYTYDVFIVQFCKPLRLYELFTL